MYQIKKVDIGSVALYSFILYLILTFIILLPIGLVFSLISNFIPDSGELETGILPFISGIFLLVLPVFYAIIGTVINVIIVAIYNLISKKFGGIKFELEKANKNEEMI
jgi:ABC-type polysaccharide/polyol phosphate export permease